MPYETSDYGNAELFAALYGRDYRYDERLDRWLKWEGHYWREISPRVLVNLVAASSRQRAVMAQQNAADWGDQVVREQLRWARVSNNAERMAAAIRTAAGLPGIYTDGKAWDTRPYLLACPNGVLDLEEGRFREGAREDLLSQSTSVAYEERARAPLWERFLKQVQPDGEVRDYLRRVAGYALTGSVKEQVLFCFWGGGSNGKNKFLDTLRAVLGPSLAFDIPFKKLERATKGGDGPAAYLYELMGKRVVTASESSQGSTFDDALIKKLTGEPTITADAKFKRPVQFDLECKFFLAFNNKPYVRDLSDGFWRRPHLVPFEQKFEGATDNKDLGQLLLAERAGILNWALEGLREWREGGLGVPAKIVEATSDYRREMDPIPSFIEERCLFHPQVYVARDRIAEEFQSWLAKTAEANKVGRNRFYEELRQRYKVTDYDREDRKVVFRGICFEEEGVIRFNLTADQIAEAREKARRLSGARRED